MTRHGLPSGSHLGHLSVRKMEHIYKFEDETNPSTIRNSFLPCRNIHKGLLQMDAD